MILTKAENWFATTAASWSDWMRESLVSGLLALTLAAVLTWLLRRRGGTGFLCVVWLLVLARVAVPLNLTLPIPLPSVVSSLFRERAPLASRDAVFGKSDGAGAEALEKALTNRPPMSVPAVSAQEKTALNSSQEAVTAAKDRLVENVSSHAPALTSQSFRWRRGLFSLWLAGVAAGLAALMLQVRRALRIVRESTPATAQDCPLNITALAAGAGLRRAPEIRVSRELAGPAVTGLWSPVLLLPPGLADTLTPGQFRWALAHEISHLRRGDLWVQWLESLMKCAFFFHPAVWVASRQLAARREECCDQAASALTGLPARESAAGLLTLLERAMPQPLPAAALGMSGGHRMARQRLRRLLAGAGSGKRALFPWTAAAIAPAVAVLSLGAVRPSDTHPSVESRRILELESRVAELEGKLSAKTRRDTLRENAEAAARVRAARDAERYSADELHVMELIYQEAKKLPDFESMIPAMQPLFERFPASNRAGCAALYLGRRLEGEERARLLNWAADSAGDCLFLDGTSVGGLARILLARDAVEAGQTAEAKARLNEAKAAYADSIDFEGNVIGDLADAAARELP